MGDVVCDRYSTRQDASIAAMYPVVRVISARSHVPHRCGRFEMTQYMRIHLQACPGALNGQASAMVQRCVCHTLTRAMRPMATEETETRSCCSQVQCSSFNVMMVVLRLRVQPHLFY